MHACVVIEEDETILLNMRKALKFLKFSWAIHVFTFIVSIHMFFVISLTRNFFGHFTHTPKD